MMILFMTQLIQIIVPLAVTAGVVLLILGLFQLYLGLKAQGSPDVTGENAMIGETGIIREASGFRDRSIVEVRGELWWCLPATRNTALREGSTVEIVGIVDDSLILEVETV